MVAPDPADKGCGTRGSPARRVSPAATTHVPLAGRPTTPDIALLRRGTPHLIDASGRPNWHHRHPAGSILAEAATQASSMDSVDATWTRPGEVLTLDAGWTDSVVVHLTVDANLWDQTRPQLFVRMDAGTVRVDGALVLDRTGPWLWGRHQQVDLPHEAAVDG